jgi:hypothetical protein
MPLIKTFLLKIYIWLCFDLFQTWNYSQRHLVLSVITVQIYRKYICVYFVQTYLRSPPAQSQFAYIAQHCTFYVLITLLFREAFSTTHRTESVFILITWQINKFGTFPSYFLLASNSTFQLSHLFFWRPTFSAPISKNFTVLHYFVFKTSLQFLFTSSA